MGNPRSYPLGELRRCGSANDAGEIPLCFGAAGAVFRLHLPQDQARLLHLMLERCLNDYVRRKGIQSPISSGMPITDVSPHDAENV